MVIVAAVDRSDRTPTVVAEAKALAAAFDDTIHVVHVLSEAAYLDRQGTSEDSAESVDSRTIGAVAEEVAADAIGDLDGPVEAVGLVGQPASRIVEYADEQDARYVVVSGRKRSPAGKAIFGSVTQSVLLNADCPVVSAKPR